MYKTAWQPIKNNNNLEQNAQNSGFDMFAYLVNFARFSNRFYMSRQCLSNDYSKTKKNWNLR